MMQWITIKAISATSTTGQSDLSISYQESPARDKARVVNHDRLGHDMKPLDAKWRFNQHVWDWYELETGEYPPSSHLIAYH